jgi:alpha-beta hydrolase superfamily lysophospholipase
LFDAERRPRGVLRRLLDRNLTAIVVEPFLAAQPDELGRRQSSQYFTTYNKTAAAQRVQEVLDVVSVARRDGRRISLLGTGTGGAIALLALPLAGEVERTVAEASWEWSPAVGVKDELALPSTLRFGGLKAFAALAAPARLLLHGSGGGFDPSWARDAYRVQGSDRLEVAGRTLDPSDQVDWLTGR